LGNFCRGCKKISEPKITVQGLKQRHNTQNDRTGGGAANIGGSRRSEQRFAVRSLQPENLSFQQFFN
jgi:hypothetical protein